MVNRIDILGIENSILKQYNFGWRFIEEGVITTSWERENPDIDLVETPLFFIKIKSKIKDFLENSIWIDSKYTAAEAYNIKNKIHGINLLFQKNDLDLTINSDEVQLFQNQPNPFTTSTEIKFYLPNHTHLELQILDISGKIIHSYHTQGSAGIHRIDVKDNIFPTSGIYLYKLLTPSFSATKKMLIVD